MSNLTMRDCFWNKVYSLAKENKDIMIVSADMGAPSLDKFRTDLGDQFINVGIAEQNAILISAGLAMEGKKVFTYAIAPFITLRCFEQIKLTLSTMNLPVTIVGVGAGFSYNDSGPTHHTVEDISLLRTLPNLVINNMTDNIMTEHFVSLCVNMKNPNYIRLDRQKAPVIYSKNEDFTQGVSVLKKGHDMAIIATGNMIQNAFELSHIMAQNNINVSIIDVYTWPINQNKLIHAVRNIPEITILEEHTLPGGLGSSICEVLADNSILIPVRRFGLNFTKGYCYKYGNRQRLQTLYNLDVKSIANTLLNNCL